MAFQVAGAGGDQLGAGRTVAHVIEIFDAAYRSAASGQAQTLRTRFDPLPLA